MTLQDYIEIYFILFLYSLGFTQGAFSTIKYRNWFGRFIYTFVPALFWPAFAAYLFYMKIWPEIRRLVTR